MSAEKWKTRSLGMGLALTLAALGTTPDLASAWVQTEAWIAPASVGMPVAADVNTYRQHVMFLANPFMEGRGPGTRGNEIAAEYLETAFQQRSLSAPIVLDPGNAGEPFAERVLGHRQDFQAGSKVDASTCVIRFPFEGKRVEPLTNDIVPLGFSGYATVRGPVVFAGYGIQKGGPDKSYDTFHDGDDLSGRIALVLRFEPMDEHGRSRWKGPTDNGSWSSSASLSGKIQEVLKHNPAAIVLINPPGTDDPRIQHLDSAESSARWMHSLEIPTVMVGPSGGEAIVRAVDPSASLDVLRRMADMRGGVVPLGSRELELKSAVHRSPRTTWNIAGVLPGSGLLADQYILIGAHYDHVGYGYTGGSRSDQYGIVHPGADDNASGTSGLLLAADIIKRRIAAMPAETPRRSVMFVAFSAEEMGLVGSREFIKNCPVSASAIYAMLNMDMIGRLRNEELEISGTGTAEGFDEILRPMFDSSGLKIKPSPGGRGPSDHATFYGAQVPVLAFFTGMHEEYHTPRDTMDLINCEGAVRVVNLVSDIALALAERQGPLMFKSTDRAGARDPNSPTASMGNVKVRFGIAPGNYADAESGVLVGEVFAGTCAAEAGIQPGDRLLRWNGEPIGDVANWMEYLVKHSPGDTVDVGVKRKGEDLTVRVTLKSRDQAPK